MNKGQKEKALASGWNGEYYANFYEAPGEGEGGNSLRSWGDMVKHGFFSAGGGRIFWHPLLVLEPGDRIWVYRKGTGYIGCGEVRQSAAPASSVKVAGVPFFSLPLSADYCRGRGGEDAEYVVLVEWLHTVPFEEGVKLNYSNRTTVCRPRSFRWRSAIESLRDRWEIE